MEDPTDFFANPSSPSLPFVPSSPTSVVVENNRPPAATAFIVTFESDPLPPTTKKMTLSGGGGVGFVKKHNRNLSLPVVKVYENNVAPAVNGRSKKPGNYSEGYFSSDPDEENENKRMTSPKEGEINTSGLVDVDPSALVEPLEDNVSDVGSETGTYTVDKESPEVLTARLSIDTAFGIDPNMTSSRDSASWINEWASTAAENTCVGFKGSTSSHSSHSTVSKTKVAPSKIPSPLVCRAKSAAIKVKKSEIMKLRNGSCSNGSSIPCDDMNTDNAFETESYLKTTEKTLSLMAARMSVSLDSGGESDGDSFAGRHSGRTASAVHRSDSSASESAKASSARFNRTFNLRRGRLDEEVKPLPNSRPSSAKVESSTRSSSSVRSKATTPITPVGPPVLSRLDNTRLSMRGRSSSQKNELTVKKKLPGGSGPPSIQGPGGRSNSTLTSKEVEFQNWKRRKSYDPMKAAAEGKKMQAAATKKPPVPQASGSSSLTQSTSNAVQTPESPVASVLRSASFHGHGTRKLAVRSSSEDDDEEEVTLSAEEEQWPVLQAPKTSLENTPRGSRVSLHSNNSNSPRARHKLEGVDNLVVSAISGLSGKLKINLASLLKKLRYLYDEESEKYHQLSIELEQLELAESSTSPQKSSSRELALTLKNLKRLDTTVKVLNDVLFDNVDYE